MNQVEFSRSSHCHSGSCVEVSRRAEVILVRDSKDPEGPVLRFSPEEWRAFVLGVKADEFPA